MTYKTFKTEVNIKGNMLTCKGEDNKFSSYYQLIHNWNERKQKNGKIYYLLCDAERYKSLSYDLYGIYKNKDGYYLKIEGDLPPIKVLVDIKTHNKKHYLSFKVL
jgi:hypothetical protein